MWWKFTKPKEGETESEGERPTVDEASLTPIPVRLLQLGKDPGKVIPASGLDATHDGIRVHADEHAARSADRVGASAYTRGRDIYFGAGKYAPDTAEGRRLLAHEVAHAMQSEAGNESTAPVSADDVVLSSDASERNADALARHASVEHGGEPAPRASTSNADAVRREALPVAEMAQRIRSALKSRPVDGRAVVAMLAVLDREPGQVDALKSAYAAAFGTDVGSDVRAALEGECLADALRLLRVLAPDPEYLLPRPRRDA
jgi:hypothetical protein